MLDQVTVAFHFLYTIITAESPDRASEESNLVVIASQGHKFLTGGHLLSRGEGLANAGQYPAKFARA